MATRPRKSSKTIPSQACDEAWGNLLGPPPLIQGENQGDYEVFAAKVVSAIGPRDALEEIWTRDFVDLSWEVQRLRRLRAKYLDAATHDAMKEVIKPHIPILRQLDFLDGWNRQDPDTVKEVDLIRKKNGLTIEDVAARAFGMRIMVFEKIDRLITTAESRRNLAMRELERRRESLARRIQSAVPMIEDAEFHEVSVDTEKKA